MTSIDTMTLLDTDPDFSACDVECELYDDVLYGRIRLDDNSDRNQRKYDRKSEHDDESIYVDHGAKVWKRDFKNYYPASTVLEPTSTSTSKGSSLLGYRVKPERISQGIKYSSVGTYGQLFKWDFERYSFPSERLRNSKCKQKPKKAKVEDLGAREEVERLKRELRAELGGEQAQEVDLQQSLAGNRTGTSGDFSETIDLLGEFAEIPPSLLDLNLEGEMDTGYRWNGPVRDLETGRPLTPYKDSPNGESPVSSRGGSRQTARRSRPMNPGGGPGRGTGLTSSGPGGSVAHDVVHKSSTQSLPSSSRGRGNGSNSGRMHHQPSVPSFSPNSYGQRGNDVHSGRMHHQPSLPVFPPNSYGQHGSQRVKNQASPYGQLLSKAQARRHVPNRIARVGSSLQRSIIANWTDSCATSNYQQAVLGLLDRLTNVINHVFDKNNRRGVRRFEVDVFGSVSWGGETGTSGDLDMVVIDHEQRQGYMPDLWKVAPGEPIPAKNRSQRSYRPPSNLPGVYDLYKVSGILRNMGMDGVIVIRGANTPIVKFKAGSIDGSRKDLECDININDLGGWYNSALILAYCDLSPYVLRPLIHALKLWSSAQNLNDPSGATGLATMSSYCLTLMAIAYLQIRGHLPNLQANVNVPCPSYPTDRHDPDLVWVGWGKSQGTHAHVAFSRTPPEDWQSFEPDLTADQALRGFFCYFSSQGERVGNGPMTSQGRSYVVRRFDRKADVVSVLNGGMINRAEAMDEPDILGKEKRIEQEAFMGKGDLGIQPSNWKEKLLVVQDPFIWQKNCTTSMHLKGLDRWFEAVERTNEILQSSGEAATLADILAPLPAQPLPQTGKGSKAKGGRQTTADPVDRFAQRIHNAAPVAGAGNRGGVGRGGRGAAPSVNGRSSGPGRPAVGQLLDV